MGLGGFVDDVLGLAPEVQKVAGVDSLELLRTFRDELAGVEQVEVTNPDGSRSIVTRQIALSPEQQARNQQIEETITGLLQQAEDLASIDIAAQSEQFKPIVDAQTELLQNQLQEQQTRTSREQEEILAARGLSGSTVGAQSRAALAGDVARASTDIERQGLLLGEQLREAALGRTLQGLQPALQQQGVNLNLQQAALNRGTGIQLSLAGQELQRQALNRNIALSNSAQRFEQSKIATQTGIDLLSGGLSSAGSGGSGGSSGLLASLGTSLSDKRLKENIVKIGREKGINIYQYNYKGLKEKHIGVMAQEIKEIIPDAVIKDPSGYYKVDYTKVGEHLNG